MVLLLNSCITGPPAPTRSFTTEDLLLTETDVPSHWHLARIAPMGSSIGLGDEEDDRRAMFTQPNDEKHLVFASHMVLHFDNNSRAARWYKQKQPAWFNDNRVSIEEPWQRLPELSYQSAFAQQYHVACKISNMTGRKQVCSMIAQYEEYVVIFHSTIESYSVSVAGFNELVRRIDEIMATHLQVE